MSNHGKTLVLGGGPTGLATALKLARAGKAVKLIERLPWTGGLCKTFRHGPYRLDLGPHRFTPHNQQVNDFVAEDLKVAMRVVPYQAEILVGDHFITFPFDVGELLRKLPPQLSIRLISTYLKCLLIKGRHEPHNCEEWIARHFGAEITNLFFRPLIEKVWGCPLSKLSTRFARQRIAITSLWEVMWELISRQRPARFRSNFYPDNCFLYPVEGYGAITDRMTEEFEKAGGELVLNSTVKEIFVERGRIRKIVYERFNGLEFEEDPGFVATTIPIQYFFKSVKPDPPDDVLEASQCLRTRRLVLLYLVVQREQFCKGMLTYFPQNDFPFARIWEQKNQSPNTVDVRGKTVLGLELPCWEFDSIWKMESTQLFEICISPLEKHGILARREVEEFFAVKLGSVYPVWDVNFEKTLNTLLEWERSIENLIFNGRPGLFFYNNLHHSIEMGFVAANHIISGMPKNEKWNVESQAFASFRLVE